MCRFLSTCRPRHFNLGGFMEWFIHIQKAMDTVLIHAMFGIKRATNSHADPSAMCWRPIPMTRVSLLGALVLMAHALASCDGKPVAASAPPPPPVTVAHPLQKTITEWDEYTGRFVAVEQVEVRARVSGFIDTVHFNEGQLVKQGDLLFVIDPRPYRLAVEQAKADLERAQAKLQLASLDVQRAA